jgi:hypothetical protein
VAARGATTFRVIRSMAGHFFPEEVPERTAEALATFFAAR